MSPPSGVPAYPDNAAGTGAPAPPTVLLVDDERALLVVLARFIERLGCTVLAASSGPEALALAERHAGALWLVVTDVDMPEMSGAELARALRVRHPDTPVLFISGRPAPPDLAGAAAGRRSAFLAKPFALDELRAAVAALAGDARTGACPSGGAVDEPEGERRAD